VSASKKTALEKFFTENENCSAKSILFNSLLSAEELNNLIISSGNADGFSLLLSSYDLKDFELDIDGENYVYFRVLKTLIKGLID
jgi:hypothetical protein